MDPAFAAKIAVTGSVAATGIALAVRGLPMVRHRRSVVVRILEQRHNQLVVLTVGFGKGFTDYEGFVGELSQDAVELTFPTGTTCLIALSSIVAINGDRY